MVAGEREGGGNRGTYLTCITCKRRINERRNDYIAVKNHPGYCYCRTCVNSTKKLGDPNAKVP